ncbi:MAG TPA: iron-sulfur cluster assembly scaffold protein [Pyrinomonadaceae bacterium]|nr:iron-sulfur cluster assembly scaffold protein [Pyrinomonadaceae bacterium]
MQFSFEQAAGQFLNPKNVGDAAEPSFVGRATSFTCGAALRISLHIDESQRITEAKFKAAGCSILVVSASLLTDEVVGKTTGEAAALGQRPDVLEAIVRGGPENRADCAALVCEALLSAIASYSGSVRDEWNGDEALICTCFGVSETTIAREIQEKQLRTIADVTRECNAGAGCRSCYPLIEDILDDQKRVNGE